MEFLCDCLWGPDAKIVAVSLDCPVHSSLEGTVVTLQYIGFGGKTRTVDADFDLGWGGGKRFPKKPGLRTALWDFCHGYVSGFRIRDILYFIATRSLTDRNW